MNPQDAARMADIVKQIRESQKTAYPSAQLTPQAQNQPNTGINMIKNAGINVLKGVSGALNAIPPSADILPGPGDNLAFMGLALANKGIKRIPGVVDAVKAAPKVEQGVTNVVKGFQKYQTPIMSEAIKQKVPNPEAFTSNLITRYTEEQATKKTIDTLAGNTAKEVGGTLVTAPLKGLSPDGTHNFSRVIEKLTTNGRTANDISRNTIMVKNLGSVDNALTSLTKDNNIIYDPAKNYFENPGYLGYRGVNVNYKNPTTGNLSEIQINIPPMMYVKMPLKDSKNFMSPDVLAQLQKSGLPAGRGHELYDLIKPFEGIAKKQGRMIKDQVGREVFSWTAKEHKIVDPIIQESNSLYEAALRLNASLRL